jgi:hypothetical protein
MATHHWRRVATIALACLSALSRVAHADDFARIRPDRYLQSVVDDMSRRSPLFLTITGAIAASDVIVHVTCVHFSTSLLDGRTLWVASHPHARYLRVQIDCLLPRYRLVAILAHELQHVAEVAVAREVVDEPSFARRFRQIGFSTCRGVGTEQFETRAAVAAGEQVLREFDRRAH